jgi:hypothetical protein
MKVAWQFIASNVVTKDPSRRVRSELVYSRVHDYRRFSDTEFRQHLNSGARL